MTCKQFLRATSAALLVLSLSGCAEQSTKDYSMFLARRPRSILVLPPLNQSKQVDAPYIYLSTITKPLAECGYYVLPVALADAVLKEYGLLSNQEMHTLPLDKIRDILGADAVLYVTIEDWGQKFVFMDSATTVKTKVRLVDVATGTELWTGSQDLSENTSGNTQTALGRMAAAAAAQMIPGFADWTRPVSTRANNMMVFDEYDGFVRGNYQQKWADDGPNPNDLCFGDDGSSSNLPGWPDDNPNGVF